MSIKFLFSYLHERFPVINMALFAILFLTLYSVANYFSQLQGSFHFNAIDVLGIIATISFFFRLRVFDEIKDFDLDAINHPNRILQSGKIQLKHLLLLSSLGLILEITWSFLMGYHTFVAWIMVFSYSLLMRYEFFISNYLKKRLILYAFTHMLIMPLIILWIWSAYNPGFGLNLYFALLAVLSLLGGFSFEIARKIKIYEEERELVDSYSKILGFGPSIVMVLIILMLGVLVQLYLLLLLQASILPFLLIAILYLGTVAVYLAGIQKPRAKTIKAAEIMVSLFMLVSYLSIILVVNF